MSIISKRPFKQWKLVSFIIYLIPLMLSLMLIVSSLLQVGLSKDEQAKVWRVLAAVLHLGNVQVETNKEGKAAIKGVESLKIVAELLQVPPADLQASIVLKKMRAGTTEMMVPLDQDKAERLRGMKRLFFLSLLRFIYFICFPPKTPLR